MEGGSHQADISLFPAEIVNNSSSNGGAIDGYSAQSSYDSEGNDRTMFHAAHIAGEMNVISGEHVDQIALGEEEQAPIDVGGSEVVAPQSVEANADLLNRCATSGCSATRPMQNSSFCTQHAGSDSADLPRRSARSTSTCSISGCSRRRHLQMRFCVQHSSSSPSSSPSASRSVKARRRCAFDSCLKKPTHGVKGNRAEFCRQHADVEMEDLVNRLCITEGCSKYAVKGTVGGTFKDRKFCSAHAPQGMVDVLHKKCAAEGCSMIAGYGKPGTKTPEMCAKHKLPGMVNSRYRRCAKEGCFTQPSYGLPGTRKAVFCSRHAEKGMVSAEGKDCRHEGCSKRKSFGVKGSRKTEFCRQHAKPGMVNLNKTCGNEGCDKRPSYGVEGSRKAEFCHAHAPSYMRIISRTKVCASPGCTTRPGFAKAGAGNLRFCRKHATEEMVGMMSAQCRRQYCKREASHGEVGSKTPIYCYTHSVEGMVTVREQDTCGQQGCLGVAAGQRFNADGPESCVHHARTDPDNACSEQPARECSNPRGGGIQSNADGGVGVGSVESVSNASVISDGEVTGDRLAGASPVTCHPGDHSESNRTAKRAREEVDPAPPSSDVHETRNSGNDGEQRMPLGEDEGEEGVETVCVIEASFSNRATDNDDGDRCDDREGAKRARKTEVRSPRHDGDEPHWGLVLADHHPPSKRQEHEAKMEVDVVPAKMEGLTRVSDPEHASSA